MSASKVDLAGVQDLPDFATEEIREPNRIPIDKQKEIDHQTNNKLLGLKRAVNENKAEEIPSNQNLIHEKRKREIKQEEKITSRAEVQQEGMKEEYKDKSKIQKV